MWPWLLESCEGIFAEPAKSKEGCLKETHKLWLTCKHPQVCPLSEVG